jgi:uncharacterized protein with gpF-like domain
MPPRKRQPKAKPNGVVLKPIRPGLGIEVMYRKRLDTLLQKIHASVLWWVAAEYKKHPPAMAQDSSPIEFLTRLMRGLRNRWMKKINETAPKLAEYFASAINKRSDAQLKKILKDGGWTINFQRTKAMNDVWAASVAENVSLIKSIPETYLRQVEETVSRAFANGYNLKRLTDELQERFKVSKKRASLIARDQSNKLSGQMSRVRMIENNITTARWAHAGAGARKHPRKTHLHLMNGQEFDLREGLYDPDPKVRRKIHCAELPNCFCIARAIIPGVTRPNARGIAKEEYQGRLKEWKESHNR